MDFANILFGGPCNRRCPFCIGKQLPEALQQDNLKQYPLAGQQRFVEEVLGRDIRQIVFTGTVTDPQLYRYEERLLAELRRQLPGRQFSLHTNGARALAKLKAFNSYDRVCLSFPSFDPNIYERLMGSSQVPDLARILQAAQVPVKISCVLTRDNVDQLPDFLDRCHQLGVTRLVLRQLFLPAARVCSSPPWVPPAGLMETGRYRANPTYSWKGMEVTWWDFARSESHSLNLFPDGSLSDRYLLSEARPLVTKARGGADMGGEKSAPPAPV